MTFSQAPRPPLYLAISATITLALLALVDELTGNGFSGFLAHESLHVRIFIFLLAFYFSVWAAYFASVMGPFSRFQTLRLLLWEQSLNASTTLQMREKGRSTLTTQAIFTAISVFVISAIHNKGPISLDGSLESWEAFSNHLVLTCALLAVVLLILSADAVETSFNNFSNNEERYVRYFFQVSAFRKYFGFVLAVMAIVLFVSSISPFIAILGLSVFLCSGYALWFPRSDWLFARLDFYVFILISVVFVFSGVVTFG